jgi:hypothetical protein
MLNSLATSPDYWLVLSSELSGSQVYLFTVHASISLIKTKGQIHDCVQGLTVGMSLSQSKISVSQSSDISEHVSTYNSHKISLFFITHLRKAMISTEISYERK